MSAWTIRSAVESDAAALSELAERTFRDAFAAVNTPEDMDLHCSRFYAPAVQAAEIRNPAIRTFVAESDGSLIAYAQLRLDDTRPPCVAVSSAVELRRIYVDRRWHGTGVARALMNRVIERAIGHGAEALWLGVWERNPRAIRFYQSCGFSEIGDQPFILGNDPQRDLVMIRELPRMNQVNLEEKLATFSEHWQPRTVTVFNGHDVMVVKVQGEFVWHKHDDTDDFFLVLKGHLTIQLRDREVHLGPGELFVVPKGVEHRPVAKEEVHLLLIEPSGTPNTGDPATAAVRRVI